MKTFASLATISATAAAVDIAAEWSRRTFAADAACFPEDDNPLKIPRSITYQEKDDVLCIRNVSELLGIYSENYERY